MYSATFLWQLATDVGVTIPDHEKWFAIRIHRNELLSRCDWTQIPDAALTLEEKQAWAEYRQALRNLPQEFATPDEVNFPDTSGAL